MLYDVFVFKYIYMYSFNERLYLLAFSCILNAILRKFQNILTRKNGLAMYPEFSGINRCKCKEIRNNFSWKIIYN